MWYPGKRLHELEKKVLHLENISLIALNTARSVRADFNSRFAESIDRKYEFDEILECLDDIMEHLQL
ncbi:hypothetical protein LDC_2371 [sediment metagenome]|uniref:Uncharacterized protein n=1 Tax=sediment metagenome TaxID=749907 RepID=D9PLE8_9ZZZZ